MSKFFSYPVPGSGGGGGGSVTGSGAVNQIAVWSGTTSLTGFAGLEYNSGTTTLSVVGDVVPSVDAAGSMGTASNRFLQGNFSSYFAVGKDDGSSNIIYITASNADPQLILKKNGSQGTISFDDSTQLLEVDKILRMPAPSFANFVVATTLGTVVGKVAIYDADGTTVLGFLPLYDAIT